jgi:hypothetical protein
MGVVSVPVLATKPDVVKKVPELACRCTSKPWLCHSEADWPGQQCALTSPLARKISQYYWQTYLAALEYLKAASVCQYYLQLLGTLIVGIVGHGGSVNGRWGAAQSQGKGSAAAGVAVVAGRTLPAQRGSIVARCADCSTAVVPTNSTVPRCIKAEQKCPRP